MVKKETIIRLVVLGIVIINQILVGTGVIDFIIEENQIYELVSLLAITLVPIWTAWKNNSLSKNAIKADEYLKQLKGE